MCIGTGEAKLWTIENAKCGQNWNLDLRHKRTRFEICKVPAFSTANGTMLTVFLPSRTGAN